MKSEHQSLSHLGTLIALVLCILVFMTGLLVARIHRSGQEALAASEQAFDRGDLEVATTAAREALTWYLPGAPHNKQAVARLRAIAVGAEATGDLANALRAWEALRGGLFATAHPWSSDEAAFAEASAGVARLLVRRNHEAGVVPAALDSDDAVGQYYQAPAREPGRDWFAVGSSIGMLLMLVFGARVLSGRQFASAAALVFTRAGLLVGVSLWLLSAVGY